MNSAEYKRLRKDFPVNGSTCIPFFCSKRQNGFTTLRPIEFVGILSYNEKVIPTISETAAPAHP